jgi:membrane protease subunit HflK
MPDETRDETPEAPPPGADAPPPEESAGPDTATQSLADALRTSFAILKLIMALAIVVFLLRGFFTVDEGTVVLVKRFGAFVLEGGEVRRYTERNIYYAIPLIDEKVVVEKNLRSITLDDAFRPARNLAQQTGGEPPQGPLAPGRDGYAITGDTNIVHSTWTMEYRIADPYLYHTSVQEWATDEVNRQTGAKIARPGPEQLLREIFRNAVVRVTAGMEMDRALRNEGYQSRVARLTRDLLSGHPCGLELVKVSLKEPEPPASVKPAFNEVNTAQSDAQGMIDQARKEAEDILGEARGERAAILSQARVYAQEVVSSAQADAENLRKLLATFPENPAALNVYLQQQHQEMLAEVLRQPRLYLLRPGETWYMTAPPAEGWAGEDE